MFKYFKEGDLASENGQVMRVLAENVQPYLDAKLVNGEPKYKEVTFKDWWEDSLAQDTKDAWLKDAPENCFLDDTLAQEGALLLSLETGEPVEDVAEEAVE